MNPRAPCRPQSCLRGRFSATYVRRWCCSVPDRRGTRGRPSSRRPATSTMTSASKVTDVSGGTLTAPSESATTPLTARSSGHCRLASQIPCRTLIRTAYGSWVEVRRTINDGDHQPISSAAVGTQSAHNPVPSVGYPQAGQIARYFPSGEVLIAPLSVCSARWRW